MRGKTGNLGIGFLAIAAAFIIGYSAVKNKSIAEVVFMREGKEPESAKVKANAEPVPTSEGAPSAPYPPAIEAAIAYASSISGRFDYAWGGGHKKIGWPSKGGLNGPGGRPVLGFDCSGAVSGVLHAAGFLNAPKTSGELESWGVSGRGKFLTVFANADHTFMSIGWGSDKRWFGTGHIGKGGGGPEWGNHDDTVSYKVRHWPRY